jgi:hypothetical protein
MRDAAARKERATLVKELCDLLTDTKNDKNYFKRLLWANEWIAYQLADFEFDTVHEEREEENYDD